jgi:hypothetical protein
LAHLRASGSPPPHTAGMENRVSKIEIHTTELKTFKRCRRQWAMSVLAQLRPQRLNMNFLLGSAIHAFLEAFYTSGGIDGGDEAYERGLQAYYDYIAEDTALVRSDEYLWAMQEDDIESNIKLGECMIEGYREYARENDDFKVAMGGGKPLAEIRLEMPILNPKGKPSGMIFAGTIDAIIRNEVGYWLWENKTASQFRFGHLRQDEQATNYMAWAQEMWPKLKGQLRGVEYNFLRKEIPSARVKAPLFHRECVYRNQHEIEQAKLRLYYVAKDMKRVADNPDKWAFPSPTRDCSWDCSYREICMAMDDGTNVEILLEANFRIEDTDRTWTHDWMPKSL